MGGGGFMNEWVSEFVVFPYSTRVQCLARLHAQLDSHNSKTGPYEYRAATS